MNTIASTVMMIRPAAFGYNAETAKNNVFQNQPTLTTAKLQQKAVQEFDAFVAALQQAGIEVLVVEDIPSPPKPDAVFPNNWFCTLPDGTLAYFPMYAQNRRIERRKDIETILSKKFKINHIEDWSRYETENLFLEGTGSIVMDHEYKIAYACLSPRTDFSLFKKFAEAHAYKPIAFHATDLQGKDIYHTNVMMHIGKHYAAVCMDCVTNYEERKLLETNFIQSEKKLIPLSFSQIKSFAGNMLQLKNEHNNYYTIISNTAFQSLTQEQRQQLNTCTTLLPVGIPTIENVGGGSVRCMLAEIFLSKL